MIWAVAALDCFALATLVNWILKPEDWTRLVKISHNIIVICGFIFAIISLIYTIAH